MRGEVVCGRVEALHYFLFLTGLGEEMTATCAICLCSLPGDPERYKLPSCSHTFCTNCILKWVKEKNECPLCRRPVLGRVGRSGDDTSEPAFANVGRALLNLHGSLGRDFSDYGIRMGHVLFSVLLSMAFSSFLRSLLWSLLGLAIPLALLLR